MTNKREGDFFAMLLHPNGVPMPITDGDMLENVRYWKSAQAVHDSLKNHGPAQAFGYEIFELGTGA